MEVTDCVAIEKIANVNWNVFWLGNCIFVFPNLCTFKLWSVKKRVYFIFNGFYLHCRLLHSLVFIKFIHLYINCIILKTYLFICLLKKHAKMCVSGKLYYVYILPECITFCENLYRNLKPIFLNFIVYVTVSKLVCI